MIRYVKKNPIHILRTMCYETQNDYLFYSFLVSFFFSFSASCENIYIFFSIYMWITRALRAPNTEVNFKFIYKAHVIEALMVRDYDRVHQSKEICVWFFKQINKKIKQQQQQPKKKISSLFIIFVSEICWWRIFNKKKRQLNFDSIMEVMLIHKHEYFEWHANDDVGAKK